MLIPFPASVQLWHGKRKAGSLISSGFSKGHMLYWRILNGDFSLSRSTKNVVSTDLLAN